MLNILFWLKKYPSRFNIGKIVNYFFEVYVFKHIALLAIVL